MSVCSICLDEIDDSCITLDCDHRFHVKCINVWFLQNFDRRCPMCRTLVTGYKNKRSTRNDTLSLRIEEFEKEYYGYILKIYNAEDAKSKTNLFDTLLKLIDRNRFMLGCDEFKQNIRECLEEPAIKVNKAYWIDKLDL